MSPVKLIVSGAAIAVLWLSTVAASGQDPRGAPPPLPGADIGPLEKQANPVTRENPMPKRIYSVLPVYPLEASSSGLSVTFTVKATLGQLGRVDEARVAGYFVDPAAGASAIAALVQFRPRFTQSALDAVRLWRFEPPVMPPISLYAEVKFQPGADSTIVWHDAYPPSPVESAPVVAPAPPAGSAGAIRVTSTLGSPQKVKDVRPVYPQLARLAKASGTVIVEITVGADGKVVAARVLRSIALLDQAALDAVRQWEYVPTLVDGVPTPIVMSAAVDFVLD
jgi:protein TonB